MEPAVRNYFSCLFPAEIGKKQQKNRPKSELTPQKQTRKESPPVRR
jgi:hypothetical protein